MSDIFVGIDVAKAQLDVAIRPEGATWTVNNDETGIAALVAQLRERQVTLVVLEATGGYEAAVVAELALAMPVAVVNPRQVRDFARATGQLAKTDKLDAMMLARFADAVRPEPRPLKDDDTQYLTALVARRRQLVDTGLAGLRQPHLMAVSLAHEVPIVQRCRQLPGLPPHRAPLGRMLWRFLCR